MSERKTYEEIMIEISQSDSNKKHCMEYAVDYAEKADNEIATLEAQRDEYLAGLEEWREMAQSAIHERESLKAQLDELLAAANGIEAWWRLPNIARTVDTIEPPMRAIIEAIANAEKDKP